MDRSLFTQAAIAVVCVLFAVLLRPHVCHAQFDLEKVKKKAEKELKRDSDDRNESRDDERSPVPEAAVPSPEAQQQMGGADGGDAGEMLTKAYHAIRPLLDINSVYGGMLSDKREAQNFYDKCRTADYPNNREVAERAIEMNPDLKRTESFKIDDIMTKFPAHFDELIREYLIREINAAIELAYAEKAKGASRAGAALEAAEAALLTADGVLICAPGNTQVQQLRADAAAAAESMGASLASAVYTGDFHRENAGRIVFASAPITPGQEDPSAMRDAFAAGDRIYGMMYFKGTYSEVTGGSNIAYTKMLVDGNEMVSYNFKLDAAAGKASTLKSEVVPDTAESTTRGALIFTEKLKDISPRRHTITIRTTDDYNNTIAEGSFSLDCSGGLDRVAEVYRQLEEKKLAGVELPAPAMRNAALEKQMIAALGEWNETPLKVIITDRDWTIQHHPVTGAIVSRTINTTTVFKKADGGCRMFEISFRQQYTGSGYGSAQQYGVGDSADVLCSKVK